MTVISSTGGILVGALSVATLETIVTECFPKKPIELVAGTAIGAVGTAITVILNSDPRIALASIAIGVVVNHHEALLSPLFKIQQVAFSIWRAK